MDEYITKCTDYPKYQALKYFKEHREEFETERWHPSEYTNGYDSSPPGELFNKQSELQDDVDYASVERYLVRKYGSYYYKVLQAYCNNDEEKFCKFAKELYYMGYMRYSNSEYNMNDWRIQINPMEDSYEEMSDVGVAMEIIDKAIDKSPRLQQDTVLYGYARLPTDSKGNPVKEGRMGTYNGLRGVSYNKNIVHNPNAFLQRNGWVNPETRYNITYYCLKGTKGLNLDDNVNCSTWQNERLFRSNQRAITYEVNEDTKEAIVIIY